MEGKLRTSTLLRRLRQAPDMTSFLQTNADSLGTEPFCAGIAALARQRGESPERIIARAGIERSFGHQLFNGTRSPSRDKVLQLAFGFELGVDEAQKLLRAAGKSALYPRIPRDAAVLFCLDRHLPLLDAQALLADLDMTLRGGGTGRE